MSSLLKPIINGEEYSKLSVDDKAKYKVYVPESDLEIKSLLDLANTQTKAMSYLKPLHDKIMAMPVDLPGKQFAQAMETLETLISLLDPIKALMGVPIIGQLVKPLVNFLNSLLQTLGNIFYIMNCLILMKDVFTDSYVKVINDINWDELDQAKETIKRKKEAAEKAAEDAKKELDNMTEEERKAFIDKRKKEIEEEKQKLREAVEKEIAKDKEDLKKQVKKMYDNFEIADNYAKVMKAMKTALAQYSWENGTIKQSTVKVLESLGVDLSPLDQMTPEQEKEFRKRFPDPKEQIETMNIAIGKLNKGTKYVLITENKPVEEEIVEKVEEIKEVKDVRTSKLSEHFYLYELTQSSTARQKNIENVPSASEIENLRLLCVNVLEPIYNQFGKPTITSGYRCAELNKAVGGAKTSEHQYGKAVDIIVPGVPNETLARWISKNCVYRQLIIERSKTSQWIHVSYNCTDNKCQNLTYNNGSTVSGLLDKNNSRLV